MIILYQSLVESRLRYCNTVWSNCGETLKDKLQKLQNRAARVVTKTKYCSIELDILLKNLGWLNVQQLINLDTASMVHKAINNVAPSYLSELFHKTKTVYNHDTRGSTHGLFPKHSNLKYGQEALPALVVRYGIALIGMFRPPKSQNVLRKPFEKGL